MCVSTASAPTTAPPSTQCVDARPAWRPLWPSCCLMCPWRPASPGGHPGDAPTAAASWQSESLHHFGGFKKTFSGHQKEDLCREGFIWREGCLESGTDSSMKRTGSITRILIHLIVFSLAKTICSKIMPEAKIPHFLSSVTNFIYCFKNELEKIMTSL